jgi:adenylate kinase family enzyme
MSMSLEWHPTQPDIVIWTVGERFTMQEFYDTISSLREQVEERQPERYYIVTDMSQTRHFPKDLMTGFRNGHRAESERYGGTIMVGSPAFVQGFVNLLQKLSIGENKYHFVRTLYEAFKLIEQKRAVVA